MPVSEFIFVLVVLLGIAMLVTGLCRKLPVPFTVVLVLIGVLLSDLSDSWALLSPLQEFELSPEVMLFIFLPALIFESGFALDARQMTKDLPAILMLAIPAMLLSTVIVGFGVWYMLDTRLIVALVFGALISATDPVAVVALFKELGAPNRLMVLVEGESLLNDATAIVAFSILVVLAVEGSGITLADVDNVILEFLRVFVGGAVLGIALGFGACEILYRIHANTSVILTTSIIVAYAAFVGGEHILHVSGVMAVVGAAISLRLFGMSRIRQDATHSIHETWEVIALCCNSLLFLMVGLSVNTENLLSRIGPVVIVIALVLAARALSIYTLVPMTVRLFKMPKVSLEERHIMWWGGLKGGLAIAVVLSIPSSLPEREFLFDLTIGMVMFTLLICAPTINPLMSRLGMNAISRGETLELRSALIGAQRKFKANVDKLIRSGLVPETDVKRYLTQIENSLGISWYLHQDSIREDRDLIAMLRVYHVENRELKNLYETGFIKQYVYLDMQNHLYATREALRQPESETDVHREQHQRTYFLRLERGFLRFMRKRHWTSIILSRFQGMRMTKQLQRSIAYVVICDVVIDFLENQTDLPDDVRDRVMAIYQERREYYGISLRSTELRYPTYYRYYLNALAKRSIVFSGWNHVHAEFEHTELNAKGYKIVQRKVENLLALPGLAEPRVQREEHSIAEIIEGIELFAELGEKDIKYLEKNTSWFNFLSDDTILEADETGDSVYVIVVGKAAVWVGEGSDNRRYVANLGVGDILGETALIEIKKEWGRHRHSATIVAITPCSVLRISTRTMRNLIQRDPALKVRIQQVHNNRRASKSSPTAEA